MPKTKDSPGQLLLELRQANESVQDAFGALQKAFERQSDVLRRIDASRSVSHQDKKESNREYSELRKRIVRDVNAYCYQTGSSFKDVWTSLYNRFRDRYHANVWFDSIRRGDGNRLDALEDQGYLPQMAELVRELPVVST